MTAGDEADAADRVCCAETRLVISTTCPVLKSARAPRVGWRSSAAFGQDTHRQSALRAARPSPLRHYLHSTPLWHRFKRSTQRDGRGPGRADGSLGPLVTSQEPRQDSPQRRRRAQSRVKSAFRSGLSKSSVCSVVQYRIWGDLRGLDVAAGLATLRGHRAHHQLRPGSGRKDSDRRRSAA